MPRLRSVLAGLVIPSAALLAACAEAPPPQNAPATQWSGAASQRKAGYPQEAPQAPPGVPRPAATSNRFDLPGLVETAPTSVPEAVAQLDRAEQLLGFLLSPARGENASTKTPAPAATSAPAADHAPVPLGDPCLIACAALASMKRSAEHVCTMAGDKDAACDSARARAGRAEQRVLAACPACAAAANPG